MEINNKRKFTFKRSTPVANPQRLHHNNDNSLDRLPSVTSYTGYTSSLKPMGAESLHEDRFKKMNALQRASSVYKKTQAPLLQASLTAFIKPPETTVNKPHFKPVAAVAPHRSPERQITNKRKRDEDTDLFDADDFDDFVASLSTATTPSSQPKPVPSYGQAVSVTVLDSDDDIRTPPSNKSHADGRGSESRKRHRLSRRVIRSDDEDELDTSRDRSTSETSLKINGDGRQSYLATKTHQTPNKIFSDSHQQHHPQVTNCNINSDKKIGHPIGRQISSNTASAENSRCSRNYREDNVEDNTKKICGQSKSSLTSLLKSPQQHPEKVKLQEELLTAMNKVCDIIATISSGDLMNVLSLDNYERLQYELTSRRRLNMKLSLLQSSNNHTPAVKSVCNPLSSAISPLSHNIQSTPVTISGNTSSTRQKSRSSWSSPIPHIPCGDSFFQDDSTFSQSHVNFLSDISANNSPNMSLTPLNKSPSNVTSEVSPHVMTSSTVASTKTETSRLDASDGWLNTKQGYNVKPSFSSSNKLSIHKCTTSDKHTINRSATESIGNKNIQGSSVLPDNSFCNTSNVANQNSFSYNHYNENDFSNDFMDFSDELEMDLELEERINETPRKQLVKHPVINNPPSKQTDAEVHEAYENYEPIFSNNDKDDGAEFQANDYPHSFELQKVFRTVFGLRTFRQNQLEAINAALLGHDCFILMPTGGGKSLCYQLPSLVTDGVTMVISPLRALIQDQVTRLISFGIQAAHLSSDVSVSQAENIYRQLCYKRPSVKLLYVTPEKISASAKLLSAMEHLYQRKLLDRFIIDEAHCVSQWGHDFRPDYKKLNVLREKFPGVPMMALTATATPRVRKDIIHQLSMQGTKWFMQSFNRPNLKYSVMAKKPKTLTQEIIGTVQKRFNNQYGIVYCLSRKECDTVAQGLKSAGIKAAAYHAGLTDTQRTTVQENWISGDKCKVICATIAFGMGIDKPDVRFVIHYSLPKSVEGYYQEAGRSGRDGDIAHCILYYNYQDVTRLRRMIQGDDAANFETKKVHMDNLFRMVRYCENIADCRRSQILQYFGENYFDRRWCNKVRGSVCDTCDNQDSFVRRDVTDDAIEIVKCVQLISGYRCSNYTLLHLVEIFKGSKNTKVVQLGHDKLALHGKGSAYDRRDAERLLRKLVVDGILMEELCITAHDHAVCYVKPGRRAADLVNGLFKIDLDVHASKASKDKANIGQESKSSRDMLIEACYEELIEVAKTLVKEHNILNYATVFPNMLLRTMARVAPSTEQEITEIDGLPRYKYDKYGCVKFLEVTAKYAQLFKSMPECTTALSPPLDNGDDIFDTTSSYFSSNTKAKSRYTKKFNKWKKGKKGGSYKNTNGRGRGKGTGRGGSANQSSSTASNNKTASKAGLSTNRKPSGLGFMPAPQPKSRSFLSSNFAYK